MSLFILIFLAVYGSANAYFFLKARPAALPAGIAPLPLALFLAAMVAAPLLVRVLERHGHDDAARFAAYAGYGWMGFLFLFVVIAGLMDFCRLIVRLAGMTAGRSLPSLPGGTTGFLIPAVLAIGICIYGWFEARNIREERIILPTTKLPPGVDRLRIAQISDVHVGLIVREERMQRIISRLQDAAPDILVSTGDLVDGHVRHFDGIAGMFRELRPRYGAFAVTGNHEYYAGIDQSVAFTQAAGFTLLENRAAKDGIPVVIAGVDDPAAARFGTPAPETEQTLLGRLPRDRFVLFLKHRPTVADTSAGLFDLQLSGHVHKGQIFPFNLLTYLNFPVHAGLNSLAHGSDLYVSRGTGTWGPPIRFLASPEVTVIDLVRPQDGSAAAHP